VRDRRQSGQRQREHGKAGADDGARAQLVGRVAADDHADARRGAPRKSAYRLAVSQRSGRSEKRSDERVDGISSDRQAVVIGGNATDKLGRRAVIRTSLSVLALALAALSTSRTCCRLRSRFRLSCWR